MCPSTEGPQSHDSFATDVLRNLLLHIDEQNAGGNDPFVVSYGWTEGPVMYLVYTAPPSAITWGLVRDTRESNIEPAPWPSMETAVRYYYLLDLCEGRVSESFTHPGSDPDSILWHGDRSYADGSSGDLPQHPSEIFDGYRYTPPPLTTSPEPQERQGPAPEPRRYGNAP
ncbi:hypothetical protein FHT44_005395 [Mycolicibacterium sp. BK634]|nr:hypothetical protein [Mycolicibacterium sp. BK634]